MHASTHTSMHACTHTHTHTHRHTDTHTHTCDTHTHSYIHSTKKVNPGVHRVKIQINIRTYKTYSANESTQTCPSYVCVCLNLASLFPMM